MDTVQNKTGFDLEFLTSNLRPYHQKSKLRNAHQYEKLKLLFSAFSALYFSRNNLICYFAEYLLDIVKSPFAVLHKLLLFCCLEKLCVI